MAIRLQKMMRPARLVPLSAAARGRLRRACILISLAAVLAACAVPPPPQPYNVCKIFKENKTWLNAALETEKRWSISASVTMAFIYHESSFVHDARPPRKREKILGFIPIWKRVSTAYGYAQATDPAWDDYKHTTGRVLASRSSFKDAIDFIGWYNDRSARALNIGRHDAYNLYLAYHEGVTGYRRGSYKKKPALKKIARRVEQRKIMYAKQIKACGGRLPSTWYIPNLYL